MVSDSTTMTATSSEFSPRKLTNFTTDASCLPALKFSKWLSCDERKLSLSFQHPQHRRNSSSSSIFEAGLNQQVFLDPELGAVFANSAKALKHSGKKEYQLAIDGIFYAFGFSCLYKNQWSV